MSPEVAELTFTFVSPATRAEVEFVMRATSGEPFTLFGRTYKMVRRQEALEQGVNRITLTFWQIKAIEINIGSPP